MAAMVLALLGHGRSRLLRVHRQRRLRMSAVRWNGEELMTDDRVADPLPDLTDFLESTFSQDAIDLYGFKVIGDALATLSLDKRAALVGIELDTMWTDADTEHGALIWYVHNERPIGRGGWAQ